MSKMQNEFLIWLERGYLDLLESKNPNTSSNFSYTKLNYLCDKTARYKRNVCTVEISIPDIGSLHFIRSHFEGENFEQLQRWIC